MKEIKLIYPPAGPNVFKRMLDILPEGSPGEIFKVIDKRGQFFGYAFYNPNSNIAFRIFSRGNENDFKIEEFLRDKISKAIEFRKILNLPSENTNAYRLIHDYGDSMPGITADVYSENIIIEFYSIGMYVLREELKKILLEFFPNYKIFFRASDYSQVKEGFSIQNEKAGKVKILENGISFEVNLSGGYKTGFFCDQRENRLKASKFCEDKKVIDICSYTGGFGLYAKKLGKAKEVTCVELDIEAVEQGKRNTNINSLRIDWVSADAFIYMRQMIDLNRKYDVVILDPHKLITSREQKEEGIIKYKDMNKLAIHLVKEGGIFITSSCSGLLNMEEFTEILRYSASVARRRAQIFSRTGASSDHPFMVNFTEGEYLKTIWARIF